MRKLMVIEFVTLDRVMQGLGSPDEDRDGGFEHGGWAAPFFDESQGVAAVEGLKSTTAYLFGGKTYEKRVGYWPSQPDENPMAAHLNATPKDVATRTLRRLTWSNSQVLDGELVSAVRDLRTRSEEHTSELQSRRDLVCRLLLEKKKKKKNIITLYKKKKTKQKT